jgi:hypothetical protein
MSALSIWKNSGVHTICSPYQLTRAAVVASSVLETGTVAFLRLEVAVIVPPSYQPVRTNRVQSLEERSTSVAGILWGRFLSLNAGVADACEGETHKDHIRLNTDVSHPPTFSDVWRASGHQGFKVRTFRSAYCNEMLLEAKWQAARTRTICRND